MTSISIFIPAYNAAKHITNVIERIPDSMWTDIYRVYIVNDGSTDSTASVINDLNVKNNRIVPVHFPQNRGYGTAVKMGLSLCRTDECSYAVCLHSDGQYPPEVIPEFVKHMSENNIDILQGSRIASGTALKGGMPLYKYVFGRLLTILENTVFGLKMTDYHSGFLLYSRNALNRIKFASLSQSFDFDLEVIACAKAGKLVIAELPIPTRYADEKSYLNPVIYGLHILKVLVQYCSGRFSGIIK
jgi:glycosyltransferase involved in cell wall biosynthesis